MKLGMSTLVELDSLEENIKLCKKIGLEFIELNMDLPYCFPDRINWSEVNKYKDIELTVHLSETLEVGNINAEVRKKQIEIIKHQILIFKKKRNIKKYNIHLNKGVYFTLPDKKLYIYEKYKNDYLNAIEQSFKELSEFAVKESINIFFENVSITKNILEAFEKVIDYPNLYYTLDIGHDYKYGGEAGKLFMKEPSKIKHMHIHDFDGKTDHSELGTGEIEITKYLEFCKENNIDAVIEVKREKELKASIEYLKNKKWGC